MGKLLKNLLGSILTVTLLSSASFALDKEFYVTPQGLSNGDGSITKPWDLQTALNHPSSVTPGDIIWIKGGTYTGAFVGRLNGTAERPIRVRAYPGEKVILDASGTTAGPFTTLGQYTWYQDLELTDLEVTKRVSAFSGGVPSDITRKGMTVTITGNNVKLINSIVHDLGVGIGNWSTATGTEIYGTIIYNNGWAGTDRGHGHGIYAQNEESVERRHTDNIVFNQFGYGFHIYTEGSRINNMTLTGNTVFNNGTPFGAVYNNILMSTGYTQPLLNPKLIENMTYNTNFVGANSMGNCVQTQPAHVVVRDNFLMNGSALTIGAGCYIDQNTGNTFYGGVSGFTSTTYPNNTYLNRVRPNNAKIFVRPNQYESGRAHITVYNWNKSDSVSVDVSSAGLQNGEAYNIYDVQNLLGQPITTGVYTGQQINIPMTSSVVAQPISSDMTRTVTHTDKEFGVFLLRKQTADTSSPPTPTVTPTPTPTFTIPSSSFTATPTATPTSSGINPPFNPTPTLAPPSGFSIKVM